MVVLIMFSWNFLALRVYYEISSPN